MSYLGKTPADVLIDPHVESSSITDLTILTADLANDCITNAKIADDQIDSEHYVNGSIDNEHLAGSIAMNKTAFVAGTGLTLSTNTLNLDTITSVGTLTSLTVDDITLNGSTISDGGDFILDVGGYTELNNDNGGIVIFSDASVQFGVIEHASSDFVLRAGVQDKDILFKGNDGGSTITALTLDMSDSGAAIFNHYIAVNNASIYGSNGTASDPSYAFWNDGDTGMYKPTVGQIGFSCGSTLALTLAASSATFAGDVTLTQSTHPVLTLKDQRTATANGDEMGDIDFYTSNTHVAEVGARIRAVTNSTWQGGVGLQFFTHPASSGELTERFSISSDGNATFAGYVDGVHTQNVALSGTYDTTSYLNLGTKDADNLCVVEISAINSNMAGGSRMAYARWIVARGSYSTGGYVATQLDDYGSGFDSSIGLNGSDVRIAVAINAHSHSINCIVRTINGQFTTISAET